MIFFVITFIIAIIIGIREGKHEGFVDGFFIGILSFVTGLFFSMILALSIGNFAHLPRICVKGETKQIVVLKDNTNSLSGHFFLGTGDINGEPIYVFYEKTESNAYLLHSIKANDCLIYENNKENPRITYYDIKFANNYYYWFAFNIGRMCRAEIFIPKGSIKQGVYKLDLD